MNLNGDMLLGLETCSISRMFYINSSLCITSGYAICTHMKYAYVCVYGILFYDMMLKNCQLILLFLYVYTPTY